MKNRRHYTIPVFIPELACPHRCIFCNQQRISGRSNIPTPDDARNTIEEHLKTLPKSGATIELGYLGGNFTGIPRHELIAFLELGQEYLKNSRIHGMRCSTRPDYINKEIINLLTQYGMTTVELGAQSMNDKILQQCGRGHTAQQTRQASHMILDAGMHLGLQMMVGMPGQDNNDAINTAKEIIALGAHETRIYPMLVIKDTPLAEMYFNNRYTPLTMDEATSICAQLTNIFEESNTRIIRMGLHPSEGLLDGKELVAGPFHVSFRELVETRIWQELLRPLILIPTKTLTINVSPKTLNAAIGYEAANKKMLMHHIKNVKFIPNEQLTRRNFEADYC